MLNLRGKRFCGVALQTQIFYVISQMLTLACFQCLTYKMENMKQKGESSSIYGSIYIAAQFSNHR